MTNSETIPVLLARIEELAAKLALAQQQERPPSATHYFAKASEILIDMEDDWGFDLKQAQEDLTHLMSSNWLPKADENGYLSVLHLTGEYTPAALKNCLEDHILRNRKGAVTKDDRANIIIEALKESGLWSDLA